MIRIAPGALVRLLAALLMTLALLAGPALGSHPIGAPAGVLADDDDDDDDDDDGGGGDDDDDDGGDDGGENEPVIVAPALTFLVEVDCLFAADEEQTTCAFSGVAAEGETVVRQVVVPAEVVCAEPVPATDEDDAVEGVLILVLKGEVTTRGEADYWAQTDEGIFPAAGPGLACEQTTLAAAATPTPAAEVSDIKGAILVQVFACAGEPPPVDGDWFAACPDPATGVTFALEAEAPTEGGKPSSVAADMDGRVRFGLLAPGRYELTEEEGGWCHAESDSVDARGLVVVTAGERATVWVFQCSETLGVRTPTPVK